MNDDHTYESLKSRRSLIMGLVEKTRLELAELIPRVTQPNASPFDVMRLKTLTMHNRILAELLKRLNEDTEAFSLRLGIKTRRLLLRDKPTINPDAITVPDQLPEEL